MTVHVIETETGVVEVGIAGPQGVPGVPGGGFQYVHTQSTPASVWVIPHNLVGFPNITVIDSSGNQHEPEVTYDSNLQVTLTFTSAFSGVAYLS